MQRMTRDAIAVAFVVVSSVPTVATTEDNIVLRWNSVLLQAIRETGEPPIRAARAFAIVHTCIYDAWAAYTARAVGTRLGGSLRRPVDERNSVNKREAISVAAYLALVDLFPTKRAPLFEAQLVAAGYEPLDAMSGGSQAAAVGRAACGAVLEFRHRDGANQLGDVNGGGRYSDYTGYQPVNTADALEDPNHWQPLRSADGTERQFLAPHWGRVTPFALASGAALRPRPPAQAGTYQYFRQAEQIVGLSAALDDRRKAIAVYWADGPNTETPPGHWNVFAQWISHRDRHSTDDDVQMFFVLGNALLDTSITVWDAKRHYDYVRPISAVRHQFAGQSIVAWAGPGAGSREIPGDRFVSYLPTPPFPEYPSGHSAFSAAAARVLQRFTRSPHFGLSVLVKGGSSPVEPGVAPAHDILLSWRTFDDAADQAGLSRRYGGIHFRDGDLVSRRIGRAVSDLVWRKALAYFNNGEF